MNKKTLLEFLAESIFPTERIPVNSNRSRKLFRFIVTYSSSSLLLLTILGLIYGTVWIGVPLLQKEAIDELVSGNPDNHLVLQKFIYSFLLLFVASILNVLIKTIGARSGVRAVSWLSGRIYHHALTLKSEHHTKTTVGETVALLASHVQMVLFFMVDVFPAFFTSVIPLMMAPIFLYYVFDINPILVLGVCFCFLGITCYLAARTSKLFQKYKHLEAIRLGAMNEWLQNIRALKTLGWLQSFETKLENMGMAEIRQRYKLINTVGTMNSVSGVAPYFLSLVGIISLLLFKVGAVAPGDIFGVLWILGAFLIFPLRMTPWVIVIGMDAASSIRRVENFLALENRKPVSPDHHEDSTIDGDIYIKNLNLDYPTGQVLKGINLNIKKGEFITIVGGVGSGKSQLIHSLLCETPASWDSYRVGSIDFDKEDPRASGLYSFVPQESFAMSARVHENVELTYRDHEDYDKDSILKSLNLAEYSQDLSEMRRGLDTELGERGVNQSGGQKQRLAIARAHYANKKIILLDDSLSAVDDKTEKKLVDQLLLTEWKGRTRILATHRLKVLPLADQIIFLKNGEIAAKGPWKELIETPVFREFVSTVEATLQ